MKNMTTGRNILRSTKKEEESGSWRKVDPCGNKETRVLRRERKVTPCKSRKTLYCTKKEEGGCKGRKTPKSTVLKKRKEVVRAGKHLQVLC